MPGLDKTGPLGQGSQTDRKMGKCKQENETIIEDMPRRFGFGRGVKRRMNLRSDGYVPGDGQHFGRGRGRRK